MPNDVYGIDLSHWDNDIDYKVFFYTPPYTEFAIIKATQGIRFKDNRYNQHRIKCIENAVFDGTYHYWEVQSSGEAQAKFFMSYAKRTPLIALDVEDMTVPEWIDNRFALAIAKNIKSFLKTVEKEWAIKPIIYTANWWWQPRLGVLDAELAEYDIWTVDYLTNPQRAFAGNYSPVLPPPWKKYKKTWKFWQYGVHAHIGEGKALDSNVWNGTREDFYRYVGVPAPIKREMPKIIDYVGVITVPLRYIRNGPGTNFGVIGHLHQSETIFIEKFITNPSGEKWGKLKGEQPQYIFAVNGISWISQP